MLSFGPVYTRLRCSQDSRRLSFSTLRYICNTTHAWNKGRQEGVSKVTL